jgi:hypothetical protein
MAFLNYASENFEPVLHSLEYIRVAAQEPLSGLVVQTVSEGSMKRRPLMPNGLNFDPVAEFSRFVIHSVDA